MTPSCAAPPREIVQMARDAGARKVYLASAAPPVRYPNVYGIDMPTSKELVAHGRTVEEVRQIIGCDALIYQDVEAMKRRGAWRQPCAPTPSCCLPRRPPTR
jgi:amidophosphoribosyltransferase